MNNKLVYEVVLTALLFFGGIEGQNLYFIWTAAFILTLGLSFKFFEKGRLNIPPTFNTFFMFMAILGIGIMWSADQIVSIKHLLNLVVGGLIWLFIHNIKDKKDLPNIANIILLLGITFASIFIYKRIFGIYDIESYTLLSYSVTNLTHHHAGDFMPLLIVVAIFMFLKTKKLAYLTPLMPAFYTLIFSYSRSSYVSLAVGIALLMKSVNRHGAFQKKGGVLIYYLFMFIIIGIVLVVSAQKGTISHRLFYLQGISGVINNPLGVGVGNFSVISLNPKNHIFGIDDYAGVADNIFLEMFVAIGVFGFVFIHWIFQCVKKIYKRTKRTNSMSLPVIIITSLFANFMFNYIYFISTFSWIFFWALAIVFRIEGKKRPLTVGKNK